MTLLILGLLIWVLAHLYKRLMPSRREAMGAKGKGVVAVFILLSLALMVIGYRSEVTTSAYTPIAGMGHLNNLLMLVAVFFFGIGSSKGTLSDKIRHPMLWGVVIWAGAHLLVNGDWASVVLFGGLGLWALVEMVVINRATGPWTPPTPRGIRGDVGNLVISLVIYGVAVGIHFWLGHSPFLGTYG